MELPDDKRKAILEAIYGGQKIEAIKLVRESAKCGLKEAKDFVEKLADELYAKEPSKFKSAPNGKGCVGLVVAGLAIAGAALMVIVMMLS